MLGRVLEDCFPDLNTIKYEGLVPDYDCQHSFIANISYQKKTICGWAVSDSGHVKAQIMFKINSPRRFSLAQCQIKFTEKAFPK